MSTWDGVSVLLSAVHECTSIQQNQTAMQSIRKEQV